MPDGMPAPRRDGGNRRVKPTAMPEPLPRLAPAPMLPFPSAAAPLPGPTPERIADLLEIVSRADQSLAAELDRAGASRHRISQITVNRLEKLLKELRPAAEIRTNLAALDPDLLHHGMGVWLARREQHGTASQRAARRWHTRNVR